VPGAEYECAPVLKDEIAPQLEVLVTGLTGAAAEPRWTNEDVAFTLLNRAENTAPLTYTSRLAG
jgi:hypothetical protein